jgi:bifunctional DNA-binding transcriptional regulator/antitoxin component of YhaV-PrlF toxin-antitoxin module
MAGKDKIFLDANFSLGYLVELTFAEYPHQDQQSNHMKTMLSADGNIGIPAEIRQTDHLIAGDSFELERLTPGHYLLTRQRSSGARFTITTSGDGLPVIRTENGVITSRLVREIESQTA